MEGFAIKTNTMKVTLGGDRLGSGSKEKIDLNEYGRSTHNLSYLFRTTASVGTVIPFACEVMLPGDQFDIDLDIEILTHPTTGPVFGSMKVGADIFTGDIRLYQGKLHNNLTGTGLTMENIKLPKLYLWSEYFTTAEYDAWTGNLDNISINPSCILAYLGIRGVGIQVFEDEVTRAARAFNAIPWIMYWDTIKNYYANQQEEEGAVIHTPVANLVTNITSIEMDGFAIPQNGPAPGEIPTNGHFQFVTTAFQPINQIIIMTNLGPIPSDQLGELLSQTAFLVDIQYDFAKWGYRNIQYWYYADQRSLNAGPISIQRFPLSGIDDMREAILGWSANPAEFNINNSAGAPDTALPPWSFILDSESQSPSVWLPRRASQEGLALKTYLSDLFNNWLNTEWLDGPGGINEITAINTTSGEIMIDTINFAEKLYKVLNRIVVAGNTYDDYMDAGYTSHRWTRPEIPVYHGGLIKELIFQEVISQSESPINTEGAQPLGTLGGRGKLGSKHKGGSINVKANEISYLMGLVHVTPKIDYSQGNRWDIHLNTVADFRLPGLDEIGFQELITEQMAWWSTQYFSPNWVQRSAGKQTAWQNYRTNVNRVFGNFAIEENEMFMTLNRRYSMVKEDGQFNIDDLTTYIDPAKYNWIFAQTSLDSQNLWIQMAVEIKARRIMSARVIPNL